MSLVVDDIAEPLAGDQDLAMPPAMHLLLLITQLGVVLSQAFLGGSDGWTDGRVLVVGLGSVVTLAHGAVFYRRNIRPILRGRVDRSRV